MKKCFFRVISFLVIVIIMTSNAYASEIYMHNLKITDVWLNPADYLVDFDMNNKSDKFLVELSNSIVGDIKDDREKIEKIYQWVIDNIYYDYVSYTEPLGATVITKDDNEKFVNAGFYYIDSDGNKKGLANAPVTTAILRRGVCQDYSVLLKYLLCAQDIPCMIVTGYGEAGILNDISNIDKSNHAWNAVFIDGHWIFMDATWDSNNKYIDGIYYDGYSSYKYFDMPLDVFSNDHLFMTYGKSDEEDIPSSWAQNMIANAINSKLVPYSLQGRYREPISRQEFCKLIVQSLTQIKPEIINNLTNYSSPFIDVDDTAVTIAKQLNIVNGTGNNYFEPLRSITRQEAAVMLSQYISILNLNGDKTSSSFSDKNLIAEWAVDDVQKITSLGIMTGTGYAFEPNNLYTIEQAIVTIERINCFL